MGRKWLGVATALGAAPIVLSGVVAVMATRPRLAARVFGPSEREPIMPADLGLDADDVEYTPGSRGWWIAAPDAVRAVVIVHGFETDPDPRSADPAPRLAVAELLHRHGVSSLVINLGYASGAHPHTGGALEAQDVVAAVRWVRNRSPLRVALVGFSAGGHACLVAASRCSPCAVVTDSSFADFGEVVIDQATDVFPVPRPLVALAPVIMRLITGHRPTAVEHDVAPTGVPTLHIHGDADTAIDHADLARVAAATGGETLTIDGADHVEGFRVDPDRYGAAIVRVLRTGFEAA